jgi:hypothetical protein
MLEASTDTIWPIQITVKAVMPVGRLGGVCILAHDC